MQQFIYPDWPVSAKVKALVTTRKGGASHAPYGGFNISDSVGDDVANVVSNRKVLAELAPLPAEPIYLKQVHGVKVLSLDENSVSGVEADASWTDQASVVCAVLTADCLPVLLCDPQGQQVAAVHAGWKGLLKGVIEETVKRFAQTQCYAWLGPAIGPQFFEVGYEVRRAFIEHDAQAINCFIPAKQKGYWLGDLYQLARLRLDAVGVQMIYGGGSCTYQDQDRFYSFRRNEVTGRMASLIWIDDQEK